MRARCCVNVCCELQCNTHDPARCNTHHPVQCTMQLSGLTHNKGRCSNHLDTTRNVRSMFQNVLQFVSKKASDTRCVTSEYLTVLLTSIHLQRNWRHALKLSVHAAAVKVNTSERQVYHVHRQPPIPCSFCGLSILPKMEMSMYSLRSLKDDCMHAGLRMWLLYQMPTHANVSAQHPLQSYQEEILPGELM